MSIPSELYGNCILFSAGISVDLAVVADCLISSSAATDNVGQPQRAGSRKGNRPDKNGGNSKVEGVEVRRKKRA